MVGHSSERVTPDKGQSSEQLTHIGPTATQLPKFQANKCYETMVVTALTKESVQKRVTPVGAWSLEQMTHKGSAATQTTKVTSK